ncbi:MAG: DUF4382 domain-containing protein [Bacteroidota bacterium]
MNTSKIKSTVYRVLQGTLMIGLIAFVAVSCGDINTSGTNAEKAQMNVNLTDAPGDYQEVNVDVQGLRVHYTPASNDTVSTDSADGKWIDLPVEPMKVNLLELTNGVDTLLAEAELDPGHYKELRLILGDDNTVMVDSTTQDLKVPSGQQSGYKIKFKTDLEAGDDIDVVVDFDAGRSVHKAGNSGKYILKPVLKAFVESGDEVEVGSVAGIVDPSEAAPNVYALMGEDTTATTQTDDDGSFLLQGLESGQYDISIESTSDQYSDTTLTDITVNEDEETDVGTVTLNANE